MGRQPYKNKEDKKSNYNFIQFSVSDSEKKIIEAFCKKKTTFKTVSQFIRESVFEYIRRIEHPELFNQTSNGMNSYILEQLTQNIKKIHESQELTNKRLEIKEDIEKNSKALKNEYERLKRIGLIDDFSKESDKIANLLKGRRSLTPKQIGKMTNIDESDVLVILNSFDKFKLNITTGRYELR